MNYKNGRQNLNYDLGSKGSTGFLKQPATRGVSPASSGQCEPWGFDRHGRVFLSLGTVPFICVILILKWFCFLSLSLNRLAFAKETEISLITIWLLIHATLMQAWDEDDDQLSTKVKNTESIVWQSTPLGEVKSLIRHINLLIVKVCVRFGQTKEKKCLHMLNSLLGTLIK